MLVFFFHSQMVKIALPNRIAESSRCLYASIVFAIISDLSISLVEGSKDFTSSIKVFAIFPTFLIATLTVPIRSSIVSTGIIFLY